MAAEERLSYFKLTPWYYWFGVFLGFGNMLPLKSHFGGVELQTTYVHQVGVLCPEVVPYDILGPLGSFLHYMNYSQQTLLKAILLVASLVHVGEGLYAYILTRRMNLTRRDTVLWVTQTTLLGFSSLFPLKHKYLELRKNK